MASNPATTMTRARRPPPKPQEWRWETPLPRDAFRKCHYVNGVPMQPGSIAYGIMLVASVRIQRPLEETDDFDPNAKQLRRAAEGEARLQIELKVGRGAEVSFEYVEEPWGREAHGRLVAKAWTKT